VYPKVRAEEKFPLYFSQDMDLSFSGLFLPLVIGTVGTGFFIYGKKQGRLPQMIGGLLLIGYPYLVTNFWLMGGIGVAIVAAIWVASLKGL
jgi:hypothetical protein